MAEKKTLQNEKSVLQSENTQLHKKVNVLEKAKQMVEKLPENTPKNNGLTGYMKKKQKEIEKLKAKYMKDNYSDEDW